MFGLDHFTATFLRLTTKFEFRPGHCQLKGCQDKKVNLDSQNMAIQCDNAGWYDCLVVEKAFYNLIDFSNLKAILSFCMNNISQK